MSINYVMYLAGERRPSEVLEEINRQVNTPHLAVAVTAVKAPVDQFVEEEHGFVPRARVHLSLDKENLGPAQSEVLDVVGLLLRRDAEDVVLLREEESVALMRKRGRIVVGDDALWADAERKDWAEKLMRRRGTSIS